MSDIHELKHGISLAIWNTSGELTLRHLADFLAEALTYFKRERDAKNPEMFGLGYGRYARGRGRVLGRFRLSLSRSALSFAQWTEALIDAYTTANGLEGLATAGKINEADQWIKRTVFSRLKLDARARLIGGFESSAAEAPPTQAAQVTLTEFGEAYLLDDVYWLVSAAILGKLGFGSSPDNRLLRIWGIGGDFSFFICSPGQTFPIAPEGFDFTRLLIDLYPKLPNAAPYPVIVDLDADGEFAVRISKAKKVRHS